MHVIKASNKDKMFLLKKTSLHFYLIILESLKFIFILRYGKILRFKIT